MANIPLKTIKFPGLDDTYTVPQVDNTLSVTGAAADAKKTGDEISELNERMLDSLFETIFGMGFVNGDMTAAGALKNSTVYVRTNAPIKLFAGDVVVCNSGFKTGIRKFTGPNVSDYDGFEKTGSSADYTIKNTGWYIIIAGFVDGRTIDDSNRGDIVQNVYVKRTLSSNVLYDEKQTNYLSPKLIHPLSFVQGDSEHTGINQQKSRFTTVTFRIKNNTIVTIPTGIKALVRKCYGLSGIQCDDITEWSVNNITIKNAEFVNISFGKTDDTDFTEEEIEALLDDIKFTVAEEEHEGGEVSLYPFTSIVTFRYDRKTINSQGNVVSESPLKHAVISTPVRFRKGDVLRVSSNTYKFAVYKYDDHAGTTFQGIVKADSSSDYTVEETGFYRVLLSYSDERTIATATEVLDVLWLERTIDSDVLLTSRLANVLPDEYLFPYSSTGVTGSMRGINGSANRIHTIPFKVSGGTTITPPADTYFMYIAYSDLNTLHSTRATAWLINKSVYLPNDTYISLGLGKVSGNYTDEEIEEVIANTKFTIPRINGIANVKDYGALGDATTDDTAAIQSALLNGGTIYFPGGTYKVTTHLILHSNTHLLLDEGATILRAGEYNMMFISDCTDETLAYNGVQNIVIEGGTLDMGEGITQGGAVLGLIHCENVTIKNVVCKHNNGTYHFFDICGCKNVLIDKCIFKDSLTTSNTAEFIQFDAAESRGAFPSPQLTEGANTFDRTISQNVEVRGCTFELNSYSPAFGNHNSQPNKNINIHDNVILGTGGSRGAVAFDHSTRHDNVTTQVLIHHNIFEGCTYGFDFNPNGTGKIYVRDNLFKSIGTLKVNPDSPVGEFLNNIELA